MYSAVLMLALTAGSESVEFGGRNRCHGNDYACSGTVAYGCYGYAGGHHHGCSANYGCNCSSRGGLFHRHRNNCSCPPACSTVVYGYSGTYGGCSAVAPVGTPPVTDKKKDMPKVEKGEKIPEPKKTEKTAVDGSATIIITLPADARLTVDGKATTSTSERRTLVTPVLEGDSTYVYTMQAEITREGRVMMETQQVMVRGGQVSNVQFNFSAQSVASR
jgi:uncharacterized protein (TIGR03000 family)